MPKTSPFIVYASQDDSFQMGHNKCEDPLPTKGGAAQAYALDFASRTRSVAEALVSASSSGGERAAYSSGCYNHAVSETETFFTEKVKGATMGEALEAFAKAQETGKEGDGALAWIEDCEGWKCGSSCR